MISKERLNHLAFIGLLIGVLTLMFFILLPYFNVFILAGTLAIIFYPLYRKITEAVKKEWLAALMTVVLVIAIFLLPLIFFGFQILKEAGQLYADIAGDSNNAGLVTRVSDSLQKSFSAIGPGISFDFDQMIKQILTWMLGQIGNIFSEITQVTLGFLLSMLALYYLLKDGSKLIKTLIRISPLKDTDDQKILNTLKTAVQSVVLGSLTIAIIQGVLAGIGFYIFGVPNGAFWSAVAAIAALIPFVGTSLILAPAVAYLAIVGNFSGAFGLLLWSATAVGLIDNILTPKLIGRGVKVHPLLILFSVLGGMSFFGPIGFLAGPIVLSLAFALIEIHQNTA